MIKVFSLLTVILALILGIFAANQFFTLRKAHSSFENYYAFRGCTQLIKKTDTYGLCKLQSGKVIKLVSVKGKWYLDKDLPVCYLSFCM